MAIIGAFALVNFSDALLLLRATELGFGVVGVSLVYVLYNVSYALLSYPAGVVSDHLSRRAVFVVGLLVFSASYIGLGLVTRSVWLWLLFPLYGAYTALTDGVSKAWVADLVPRSETATALGVYGGVTGVGALFASLWAGLAWGGNGRFPLVLAGLAAAVVALVLAVDGIGSSPASPESPPEPVPDP
jgi:MFS family permease